MEQLHESLRRQLSLFLGDDDFSILPESWQVFLKSISDNYRRYTDNQQLMEKSLAARSLALSQANADLRSIFEAMPDLFFRIDRQGMILDYKGCRDNTLDLTSAKVVGRPWSEVLNGSNSDELAEAMQQVHSLRQRRNIEYYIPHKNGGAIYEARLSPVLENQIFMVMRDITVPRLAEAALRESEERFRQLAETTGAAVFAFRDTLLYANPALEQITGFSAGELLNKRADELFDPELMTSIAQLRANSDPQQQPIRREVRMLTRNGEQRWLDIAISTVRLGGQRASLASAFDITGRKLMEEQLRHQALHDRLTGLPNRALLHDRLEHVLSLMRRNPEYKSAVLFLDLDRFKVINDSLGHRTGDELLVQIAMRLQRLLRETDTVARLGGDEFVVLLEGIEDVHEVTIIAQRMQESLAKPFILNGQEIHTSVSIGIAFADTHYQQPDHLLRDADIAMYRAKTNGKARHEIFGAEMHARAQKLLQLENDLRRAVKNEEFTAAYQPIISLHTGRTVGFEALLRWRHPGGAVVSPAEFIGLAEEMGLIVNIGAWMMRETCRQLKSWQQLDPEHKTTLSINISGRQFLSDDLIGTIKRYCTEYQVAPELLKLELTETTVMKNSELILSRLSELKALNTELVIDDFGTGYSSLSYLHQFPIDALKIDRSFVMNIGRSGENTEIIRAIIAMAHNLNLQVVAEGVETAEQCRQLKNMGCDHAQGYYFSKPVPAAEAQILLKKDWLVPAKTAPAANDSIGILH
jgi:diguanylate cyclase (GGDEF)-like protein/PAS domain S-box-containing protein